MPLACLKHMAPSFLSTDITISGCQQPLMDYNLVPIKCVIKGMTIGRDKGMLADFPLGARFFIFFPYIKSNHMQVNNYF